jgi:hypothetical protein
MRIENWESALYEFVESRRNMPFEWGKNDCALFAADAVLAMSGRDFATEYRGKYDTETKAKKILVKEGLENLVDKNLLRYDNIKMTSRGSVILYEHEVRGLGICIGSEFVAPGQDGILFFPMDLCLISWRV